MGLALAAGGNVLVAGYTDSTNFPGTSGGAQSASVGGGDAFVARLSGNLATLVQATYLGGSDQDGALALALDAVGNVLVTGGTYSTNFPGTTGGAQSASGGSIDAYVARLSSNLGTLMQATYLGGSYDDHAYALVLDAGGNVFVACNTESIDFPGVTDSAQPANAGGNNDAFVARLSGNLTTLVQATYVGRRDGEIAYALALDAGGNVLVAGYNESLDLPGRSGGAQPGNGGNGDGFVAKLSADLQGIHDPIFANGLE